MNPWPFVTAAYAVTFIAVAALIVLSWRAMKRAESALDDVSRR